MATELSRTTILPKTADNCYQKDLFLGTLIRGFHDTKLIYFQLWQDASF